MMRSGTRAAPSVGPAGGDGLSQQLVTARAEGDQQALLAVLKALEIQKTLGTDPVLTALRHFPAQAAQLTDFPAGLHPRLRGSLEGRGYEGLYTHQREVFEHVADGRDVVVVTPDRLRQDALLQPARSSTAS